MNLKFRYSHDFSAQKPTEEEHLTDFISSKHFYDPFVLHVCINLSATGTYQHRSEGRGGAARFLTHLSWYLLGRWRRSPGPEWWPGRRWSWSAARGPCLRARHGASSQTVRESSAPELQHPDGQIQVSLRGTASWMSDYCKLQTSCLLALLLLSLSSSVTAAVQGQPPPRAPAVALKDAAN